MSRVRMRSRVLAVTVAATSLILGGSAAAGARPAPIGQDRYVVGKPYRGDFPDPSLLRVGSRWFAYATMTAGLNLPVLTSTDLRHWRVAGPRRAAVPDALAKLPAWARTHRAGDRSVGVVWAPTVVRLRDGRFADVYSVRQGRKKMCISVARSSRAAGPFVDRSRTPLLCPPRGVIDPAIYREAGGTYLLYKTEDAAHGQPTRLWIRALKPGLRAFAEPTAHLLLRADPDTWENGVIEAPSMIRYAGRRYLFYSGNGWARAGYSTGYAICPTVTGPCSRPVIAGVPHPERLLRSDDTRVGPGGASAFLDTAGRLRLAFHAWTPGAAHYPKSVACRTRPTGCGQRRMHLALLTADANGILGVRSEY